MVVLILMNTKGRTTGSNSATEFEITAKGTVKTDGSTGTDAIFNKNGKQAQDGKTYNLKLSAGWANIAGTTAGAAKATIPITVSGYKPTITSAKYSVKTGVLELTGTNLHSLSDAQVGNLSLETVSGITKLGAANYAPSGTGNGMDFTSRSVSS